MNIADKLKEIVAFFKEYKIQVSIVTLIFLLLFMLVVATSGSGNSNSNQQYSANNAPGATATPTPLALHPLDLVPFLSNIQIDNLSNYNSSAIIVTNSAASITSYTTTIVDPSIVAGRLNLSLENQGSVQLWKNDTYYMAPFSDYYQIRKEKTAYTGKVMISTDKANQVALDLVHSAFGISANSVVITSTIEQSNGFMVSLNPVIKGYQIITQHSDETITVYVYGNGDINYLNYYLFPTSYKIVDTYPTIPIGATQTLYTRTPTLVSTVIDPTQAALANGNTIVVDSFNVKNAILGYTFVSGSNFLIPAYIVYGSFTSGLIYGNKSIGIKITIPAISSLYMNIGAGTPTPTIQNYNDGSGLN